MAYVERGIIILFSIISFFSHNFLYYYYLGLGVDSSVVPSFCIESLILRCNPFFNFVFMYFIFKFVVVKFEISEFSIVYGSRIIVMNVSMKFVLISFWYVHTNYPNFPVLYVEAFGQRCIHLITILKLGFSILTSVGCEWCFPFLMGLLGILKMHKLSPLVLRLIVSLFFRYFGSNVMKVMLR